MMGLLDVRSPGSMWAAQDKHIVRCEHLAFIEECVAVGAYETARRCGEKVNPYFSHRPTPIFEYMLCRDCAYALRQELNEYADRDVHSREYVPPTIDDLARIEKSGGGDTVDMNDVSPYFKDAWKRK